MTHDPEHDKAPCACGAAKYAVRVGCDDCERKARVEWAASVPKPVLPAGWARRYEPEWSCGPYFIYTRANAFLPGDILPSNANDFSGEGANGWTNYFGACELGITSPTGDHFYSGEITDVLAIMTIAFHEHVAIRAFELTELEAAVARVGAAKKAWTS